VSEYPLTNFNFVVQLNIPNASGLGISSPLCQMEFAEVDGLEMTMEPKTVREGGTNTQQTNLVGPVSYGNVTLKRGVTSNLDIWKWFAAATGNTARATRATGVIVMQDSAGQNRIRIDLFGCLPLKVKAPTFNAKDGQVAIEELQIAVTAFTVAPI
jgi:phage tail-like protein